MKTREGTPVRRRKKISKSSPPHHPYQRETIGEISFGYWEDMMRERKKGERNLERRKENLIHKRMNTLVEDEGVLESIVGYCVCELEDKKNHHLPHSLFSTNVYRIPMKKVKPVLRDVVKRGISYVLTKKNYPKSEDTNLRNYLEDGFLPKKMVGV